MTMTTENTNRYLPIGHEIEERAQRAYRRRMAGEFAFDQPSQGADLYHENGIEFVVLSNSRSVLAVYRIRKDGRLTWTEYIPRECLIDLGAVRYEEKSVEYLVQDNGCAILDCYEILEDGSVQATDYIPAACRKEWGME